MKIQTYIEKLEFNFHPNFIAMEVNQESKRWDLLNYIKMLKEMCHERNIYILYEPFSITNNFIYIKNQFDTECCWNIFEETDYGTYKINFYNLITEIYINKIYINLLDNRLCYSEKICIPEDVNRFSLTYIKELNEINLAEMRVKK